MTAHLGPAATAFVDGQLDHRQRDEVMAHLLHCQSCKAEVGALRTVKGSLRAARPDVPADLGLRLLASMPRDALVPQQRPARRPSRVRRTAVGGVLVALGIGGSFGLAGPPPSGPAPRVDPASTRFVIDHAETAGEVPFIAPEIVAVSSTGGSR